MVDAALNDRYRGLETGFTGREVAWRETLDLWSQHPLIGVGYRAHESYIQSASSAHNGYLALLAEVGLLGAVPMFLFVLIGCWRLAGRAWNGERSAVLGLAITSGYLFIAVFERYLLNFGNPTSLIVLSFLLMPGIGKRARYRLSAQRSECRSARAHAG